MEYGTIIKKARKSAGLTQQELADKLELERSYLSHIERNKRVPSTNNLFKICKILNLNSEEFTEGYQLKKDMIAILEKHKINDVINEIRKLTQDYVKQNPEN